MLLPSLRCLLALGSVAPSSKPFQVSAVQTHRQIAQPFTIRGIERCRETNFIQAPGMEKCTLELLHSLCVLIQGSAVMETASDEAATVLTLFPEG